jgi:hypothetical protein
VTQLEAWNNLRTPLIHRIAWNRISPKFVVTKVALEIDLTGIGAGLC